MAVKGMQGVEVVALDTRTTIPIVGMYLAESLNKRSVTLYLDHYTDASKRKRSYKMVPVHTKNPESLFCRLCSSVSLDPSGMSQRAAAIAFASRFLSYGALKLHRVTKKHDWINVTAIDYPTCALPWGFKKVEGLVLKSLWVEESGPRAQALPASPAELCEISEEELCAQTLSKAET